MKKFLKPRYLLAAIILLALAFRIPLLNSSFWLDEAAQALESARPLAQQLDIIPDFQPPLLHLLLHFAMRISRAEWWLRSIGALIPGLVTIFAVYKILAELKYKKAGLVSAVLLAVSSFHIFYSQEIRPYSLAAMWAMLSWLYLIRAWRQSEETKYLKSDWFNYLLATVLGLYSTYVYLFLALSQFLLTVYKYKFLKFKIADETESTSKNKQALAIKIRRHFLSLTAAGVIFLPWLPTFIQQLSAGQTLRQTLPGWETVVSLTQVKAPLITWGKFVFGVINLEVSLPFVLLSLLVFGLASFLVYKLAWTSKNWFHNWLLMTLAGCLPFLLTWLVSFWVPVLRPKRLIFVQAAMYLSFGLIIAQAWKHQRRLIRYTAGLLFTLLISFNLVSTYFYYTQPQYQRENWHGLHQLISSRFPDRETLIVMSFGQPFASWRWYNQGQFSTLTTGKLYIEDVPDLQQRLEPIYNYDFVLVFDYLRDITDPDDKILNVIESYGFEQVDTIDFPNIGFVRIYLKDTQQITG